MDSEDKAGKYWIEKVWKPIFDPNGEDKDFHTFNPDEIEKIVTEAYLEGRRQGGIYMWNLMNGMK